ncbi:hypothetical protein GH714_041222 [Hevea brasiliensis]|uniref:Cupin type-1 domain-containing protein n=1 Tax=Hevea brasiliensis TaxID=3981 RepID=A0A6A6MVK3_HEVBR|nr:hypothetical protein GH714_041222 [Hevea brasiliensis]
MAVLVNGVACKDPKMVEANDFFFTGLHLPGDTSNAVGSKVTPVNVAQIPGLNTLGISLARIDYAPCALSSQNPGVITIANAVFGSTPSIPSDILAKAFQMDTKVVNHLQTKF